MVEALKAIGYDASLTEATDGSLDPEMSRLLRATAVAGFAAMNIMLLSVSVWSGADQYAARIPPDLRPTGSTRCGLFGQYFFRLGMAFALKRTANMDLPISVGDPAGAGP